MSYERTAESDAPGCHYPACSEARVTKKKPAGSEVVDLLAALQRSVEAAKAARIERREGEQ